MRRICLTILFMFFLGTTTFAQEWTITPKYKVAFSSADASGIFENLTGTVIFDPSSLSDAKFVLILKVESIATGNFLKNRHAKGSDWFEADKFPHIKFISNQDGFKKTTNGYEVVGYLQMHGVSKLITIPFTFAKNTLNAKFSVDRTDFNIGAPDNDVSKVIHINTTIPLKKK